MTTKLRVILALAFIGVSASVYSQTTDVYKSIEQKNRKAHRIMSYNIRICRGIDETIDYDRTAKVIGQVAPEIVALQELDSMTRRSYNRVTGQELAQRLDMHFTFAPSINHDGGKYGVGLLSKEKPLKTIREPLPGKAEARTFLLAEFKNYYILVTHLALEQESERAESAEIILSAIGDISDKPVFVCGDFNATPKSLPVEIMKSKCSVLSDTSTFTIPSDAPSQTIDYIFGLNNGYKYKVTQKRVLEGITASDHLPLFSDIIISK